MQVREYDCVVIGGGAAGLAAAEAAGKKGLRIALVERDNRLGGVLHQCIHNGFGIHYLKKDISGPEFAEYFTGKVHDINGIDVFLDTTILNVELDGSVKSFYGYSDRYGMIVFKAAAAVLATGCRERNRGNIAIPGSRPSGVYTAGLAQYLVNIEGYIPGKEVVIVGSGDIGLIMARRMVWVGSRVAAVIEINRYPAGLTRNIVQCIHDFDIPLYLSHEVIKIHGKERIKGVDVAPRENGILREEKAFYISCDTLLLAVGLVPDNQIVKNMSAELNPVTEGPVVDANLMTNVKGVFACGNALHVHDLVDWVAEEAGRCGTNVAKYLGKKVPEKQYGVTSGANVRYVVPNFYMQEGENKLYLRSLIVKNQAEIVCRIDGRIFKKKRINHVQPSEMVSITLNAIELGDLLPQKKNILEISIE